MQAKRLSGRVAFVTGAGSGIGYSCAQRFADEGAVVVGLDVNECDEWEAIESQSPGSRFVVADVCDLPAQEALVAETVDAHGRLDIVVTAAGVAGGGPVHAIPIEEWDRVQNINLRGTFLSVRAALPPMMEQHSGSVITVASVEGLEGTEGGSTYNASKGGVVLLTKNIAMDYGRLGIRANSICPGFIETPLFHSVFSDKAFDKYRERIRDQHKLGRFGRSEELAGAAFFLASDDSSFVTGQCLVVDGGFTAGHRVGFTELMGLE